ncbi:MAG: 1-acyl-sn-glycerol-3-phosphate acyltransferase [Oligoflexales bacterium]|nr:1-acyl-sn-glycerol-3-phosphate acyltransferase [Oligoflexales bacterium]
MEHIAVLEPSKFKKILMVIYLIVFVLPILTAGSLLVALISLLTFFQFRNFVMTYLVAPWCILVLRLIGIKVSYKGPTFTAKQSVFICNHLSAFDIFVICSLGLPQCRYFLSVSTLKFLPLTFVGMCTGVFYVSEQADREKRVQEFKEACKALQKTGESVFLTPEGFRNREFSLQKFNKGAFHLATELKADIHCLLIDCPKECHPGLGFIASSGVIQVEHIGSFATGEWKLAQLDHNIASVRQQYLDRIASANSCKF